MIDLIISATVGAIAGSAIMRRIDLRKMAGTAPLIIDVLGDGRPFRANVEDMLAQIRYFHAAHSRAADALATKQARIDRALAVETPKAAHGVRKMARILRGDA